MDISRPLCRGFMINSEEAEEQCWVSIRYERIPEFCFKCGRIGRVFKDCPDWKNKEDHNSEDFEYGMWMKFQGFNGKTKEPGASSNNVNEQNDNTFQAQNALLNEDESRNDEGLDVDLNQISLPNGNLEEEEKRERDGPSSRYEYDNGNMNNTEGSQNMLQLMEEESRFENNTDRAAMENELEEYEEPPKKRKNWKRK